MIANSEAPVVSLPSGWERLLLAIIACLSATILLKLASIQFLEFVELALLLYVAIRIWVNRGQFEIGRAIGQLACGYGVFLALASAGALLAYTRPFYADDARGFYRPGYITLAREVELLAGASTLVVLTQVFRDTRAFCFFAMRVYFAAGSVSAVLSLAAFIASLLFGASLPLTVDNRASGFYNEGGPYGLYLVSVLTVGWVLRYASPQSHRWLVTTAQVCNGLALLASLSKAGIFAAAILFTINLFQSKGVRQRALTGVLMAGVVAVAFTTKAWVGATGYLINGQVYEMYSHLVPANGNFVIGRVAGLYFVPRMIRIHPWAGVGWGNYGLVRNNVQYRGLSVVVAVPTDQPSLGLYGLTAEIGIPLIILLAALLFWPVRIVWRHTRWRPLVTLSLIQPVVHLCGGQLNLTYPWIVTAFSLGLAGATIPTESPAEPHFPRLEVPPHRIPASMPAEK